MTIPVLILCMARENRSIKHILSILTLQPVNLVEKWTNLYVNRMFAFSKTCAQLTNSTNMESKTG